MSCLLLVAVPSMSKALGFPFKLCALPPLHCALSPSLPCMATAFPIQAMELPAPTSFCHFCHCPLNLRGQGSKSQLRKSLFEARFPASAWWPCSQEHTRHHPQCSHLSPQCPADFSQAPVHLMLISSCRVSWSWPWLLPWPWVEAHSFSSE